MQKQAITYLLLALGVTTLAGCSSMNMYNPMGSEPRVSAPNANAQTGPVAAKSAVGGHVAIAMDSIDRAKLSHALDNPLGKSTTWTNQQTGTTYTVTPTQKVVLNGNPYCRRYTVVAVRSGQTKETQGTACVSADSNWQAVQE